MSYILDALRRADAQREPEPARGIHAQPAAVLPGPAQPAAARWAWPAGAAVLLVAGGWVLWQQAAPPQPAAAPVLPVARPAAVVPVAAALLPAAPPPLPTPAVERVAQRAVLKAPPAAAAAQAEPAHAAASAPGSATAAAKTEAAPPAAAPPPRILSVAELPAAVKGELPKLAITGGVWSEDPGQRLLIVGGKVVSEGAELAPGVMLEQIRARSAVMRFKGLRYSVGF